MASNLKKMYTNLSKKLGSKFSIHLNKNRLEEKKLGKRIKRVIYKFGATNGINDSY